ncbi:MAG: Acid-resistant locus arl7 [Labilithrix sp.]|nr:Acid-resistant locus arl7 [Labilithrix sp.]
MLHSELLAQIPLFDTLAAEDLEALASRMTERQFRTGEKVFDKDDQGSSMYVVLSGAVQIFLPGPTAADPPVVLKDARTGEYFGELSLFDDKPRSASVVATVDTTLLELTRNDFGDHLSTSKNAAMTILAEMAERLRETNALLSQRAARDVVKEFEDNLTWSQRLADKVAELNGSWAFILFLIAVTILWALLNRVIPRPFDQYPYQFYNLALAILVALQGPLIVMSQNRQSSKDRATAETDFRVNLKNEVGIETLVRELLAMRAETSKRFEVLERMMRSERIRQEIPIKKPGGPLGPS